MRVLVCHKPEKKSIGRRKGAKSRECLNVHMSSLEANARANNARSARKGQGTRRSHWMVQHGGCACGHQNELKECMQRENVMCCTLHDHHLYCRTTLSARHCPQRRAVEQRGSTARPKDAAWPSCHAFLAFVDRALQESGQSVNLSGCFVIVFHKHDRLNLNVCEVAKCVD
jgi:hypothetical protein